MNTITRLGIVAPLLASCALARAAAEDPSKWPVDTKTLLDKSIFNPVLTVPLITDKQPTIDGTVNDDEWSRASLIPDLIANAGENAKGGGLPLEYRVRYYIQYDNEFLYMAARFDVPTWSAPPTVYGTAHDVAGREDAVDVFFDTKGQWARLEEWHLGGNSASNKYDRNLGDLAALWRWNPNWEYKSRVFPGGWEAEWKIAFKELGGKATPVAGEKWRANFYSVRSVPMFGVSSWAYVPTWRVGQNQPYHHGWLIFSGQPLAARFDRGANVAGSHGIQFDLVGKKPDAPVKTEFKVLKRDGMPTPDEPGQMVIVSSMFDNINVGGTDSYGMSYEQVIKEGLNPMKPVANPADFVHEAAAANGTPSVTVKPKELGEFMLSYQVTTGDGEAKQILAAGVLPFRVKPPVDLHVNPRLMLQDKVEFETDLTGLEDPLKVKKVTLAVKPAKSDSVILERSVDVNGPRGLIDVMSKDIKPGQYTGTVKALGADGAVLGSSTKDFPVEPIPDWRTNPRGFEPEVPRPWTPVAVTKTDGGAVVNVLMRKYEFKKLPVPTEIEGTADPLSDAAPPEKPQALLAAPIQLNAKDADGKALEWKCEKFEVTSQKPSQVIIESINTAAGYTLKGKTTIEFDGMIRVDLDVIGADGRPANISELNLAIPFRKETAEFLSNYRKAPGPGKIPPRFIGRVPNERWTWPIFHTQWIGTSKVGLEWFCDNMKGWRLTAKKADEASEVIRDGDKVVETFTFVDHVAKPDAPPIAISFGLIATPAKPAPRGWEILRTDELIQFPPTIGKVFDGSGNRVATEADVEAWKRRATYGGAKYNTAFAPAWTGVYYFSYPVDRDPEVFKDIKWKFDIIHSLGMKVGPYSIWAMSTKIPEWESFGAEMIKIPYEGSLYQTVYGCYNSPYTDFVVGNFVKNAKLVGLDGLRHDTIAPQPACDSEVHGCAWFDEHGKKWPSLNLFATREFFKRLYRETHGGAVQDGFVNYPVAGPPINAFDAFVDIHHIGEGNFERALTLREGYPPDEVRVRMVGAAYGYVSQNNLKGHPLHTNERIAALLVAGGEPRLMGAGLPSSYIRGYQNCGGAMPNTKDIWEAWRWIDRGRTSIWRPYWENADTLALTAPNPTSKGAKPELYGSYYYIPGQKVLLIVTNYEQEPVSDVEARLNLEQLGFKPGEKLYAEDVITREPIDLTTDGAIKIGILSQRYRLVKISRETPSYIADRLGPNLLAEGGFESWPSGFNVSSEIKGQAEKFAEPDTKVFRTGTASLKLTKTVAPMPAVGIIHSAVVPGLTPGRHLLSGYVRIDKALEPALEGTTPRHDYGQVMVGLNGQGIVTDPPKEFSMWGGTFPIDDQTPGWMKFIIPFDVTDTAKPMSIEIIQFGVGTAWIDDLQVQKVAEYKDAN